MKKQTFNDKEIINKIQKIIDKYKPVLFLDKYNISISKEKTNDLNSIAEISCNYPYLDATLFYNLDLINKHPKILEEVIVHEMIHILTDPLFKKSTERFTTYKELEDLNENLVDTLTMIIKKD